MRKPGRITARIIMLALSCAMIAVPLITEALGLSGKNARFHHHKSGQGYSYENMDASAAASTKAEEFSTHLPVVVIETFGKEPRRPTEWSEEVGGRVAVDFDPFADCEFSLIDNNGSLNHVTDEPALRTATRVRMRGNSSLDYNKQQYLIKMVNGDGTKNRQDVLGMGSDWEWILNISYIDKSLLRNYMCFNIAGEIMPYTPEVRYCEVFFLNDGVYEYNGLYLLMENAKQGSDRVNIAGYDANFAESSYILCRDRYNEAGIMLDNYATKEGLTYGYLDVKYPDDDKITDATLRYIEEDISKLEKVLFSDDVNEFLKYRDYIDVESFIGYFIINEFFMNYDAGFNSTYMHKDVAGKLSMGPVWDFDQAIDNDYPKITVPDATNMYSAVWFRQILKDADFTSRLASRYHELRKGVLSDAYLESYIDETVAYLGPAIDRDLSRWQYDDAQALQTEGAYEYIPESLLVNTRNFSEELGHVKQTLKTHAAWMDENIENLYMYSEVAGGTERETMAGPVMNFFFGNNRRNWIGGVMAVIFIVGFFSSIVLAERR